MWQIVASFVVREPHRVYNKISNVSHEDVKCHAAWVTKLTHFGDLLCFLRWSLCPTLWLLAPIITTIFKKMEVEPYKDHDNDGADNEEEHATKMDVLSNAITIDASVFQSRILQLATIRKEQQ